MGLEKPSRKQVKVLISFKKKGQIGLFEVIYTDFTEIPYDGGKRNAQLIVIIGHESKMILGWAVGKHANTDLSLEAWRRTKETFKEYHISLKGLILHLDRDSVFTGNRWVDEILIKMEYDYLIHRMEQKVIPIWDRLMDISDVLTGRFFVKLKTLMD